MSDPYHLVVFRLQEQSYALHLDVVERIVRAVEITNVPEAPEIVLGVINVAGRIIPVMNLRRRFGLPEHEIDPADHLVIAHTRRRAVALLVDEADDVVAYPESAVVDANQIVPGLAHVHGAIQLESGLVLIHDLESFLSLDEEQELDRVMKSEEAHDT